MSFLIFGIIGLFLYRWRGHASRYKKYFPRPFNQITFALPFTTFSYLSVPDEIVLFNSNFLYFDVFVGFVVGITTVLALLTGHGNNHDLGRDKRGDDETMEFVVKWLHGRITEYWYDVIAMSWYGACITLPCAIATGNIFVALSGLLRGPAYMIGWFMQKNSTRVLRVEDGREYYGIKYMPKYFDVATAIGEALTGLFLLGSLGFIEV